MDRSTQCFVEDHQNLLSPSGAVVDYPGGPPEQLEVLLAVMEPHVQVHLRGFGGGEVAAEVAHLLPVDISQSVDPKSLRCQAEVVPRVISLVVNSPVTEPAPGLKLRILR